MPGDICRVQVPSQWQEGETLRRATADFKLGLGPCGKVVDRLHVEFGRYFIHIFQRTSDGITSRFSYAVKDLTGRITTEHSAE